MGWLYSERWSTRKDLIGHLIEDNEHCKTLKHCCVGNNLWMVKEYSGNDSEIIERFILLCLMQFHGGSYCYWGYKDIDETAGPYQVNCPLSYIEMCTEPHNDYSREWRERVRQYHALRNRKLGIGDTFTYCNMHWQVCDTHGVKGWSITQLPNQGLIYRFHRRQMKHVKDIVKCQI